MQYLAEVIKKTGFMGTKSELKLLMREQSGYWHPVPQNEETIPFDNSRDYGNGVLVFVEMAANRQIRNVDEASRRLTGILHGFTRMRERFQSQEEEIEGWKQSLSYQAEALNQREQEFEQRKEELQELEARLAGAEEELAQLNKLREELTAEEQRIQAERQALENLRHQVHQEQQRWEQLKSSHSVGLSPEQIRQVDSILQQLAESLNSGGHPQITECFQSLDQQQALLNRYWQQLEQLEQEVSQRQAALEEQLQAFQKKEEAWRTAQEQFWQDSRAIALQEELCRYKQSVLEKERHLLAQQEEMIQQMRQAMVSELTEAVDVNALMKMPMEELEKEVANRGNDLKRASAFVNDQEEELKMALESLAELEQKVKEASDFDRLQLAGELEDERQRCNLLNQALEGQRQHIREKEAIYKIHKQVLEARKDPASQQGISLIPILSELECQFQEYSVAVNQLAEELQQAYTDLESLRHDLEERRKLQQQQKDQLNQEEQILIEEQRLLAAKRGQATLLREILQPVQDRLNYLRQALEGINQNILNGRPTALISELQQVVMNLGQGA
ncbi:pilus motility taxis protein HmpF [uncultured Thermosynechococcus sp.]|uniref:pilus motility taxis protein HmpF n=1 Tax=uncultured Thermosynechococcus sp. TaxID=436945 RepID=UPI00261CFB41|nr:pilus motility taxis protein HmpF [uncultured Thermosynechococcus sp.]